MLEDYEEFNLLTLGKRMLKKPLGMQERNWKHQWLQLCLARLARKTTMEKPVARLMISSQNLRVSWKQVNPLDCVWKNLYRITMRTILQEKGTIHCNITIWFTNLFLCLKQQWMKDGRNSKRFRRGTKQESETNLTWLMMQGRRAQKFIVASLMDICHLKNAELEAKHQKYKGRVVLQGNIVKHDSGAYAVFTEQGSSASQMTAAKVMDIISRLPGCAGQAADAVSAYNTQVKMEDAHKLLKIPKIGVSRHLD